MSKPEPSSDAAQSSGLGLLWRVLIVMIIAPAAVLYLVSMLVAR